MKYSIFWFRRDLRLDDNTALFSAIENDKSIIPLFIFDDDILSELPADDARVGFIYDALKNINTKLKEFGTSVLCIKGKTFDVWNKLITTYSINKVYVNKDYEPYAIKRDFEISEFLKVYGIKFQSFKDQRVFKLLRKGTAIQTACKRVTRRQKIEFLVLLLDLELRLL